MPKYLVLWELDQRRIPTGRKDRGSGWSFLLSMIREQIKQGLTKDWGLFVGETNGFSIMEGTEVEVTKTLQKYVPFSIHKVKQVMSIDQAEEVIKNLIT